jgi:EAL domain-containing protein (putative c-di-GMP-specific phosphodiesterase class I)
LFPDDGLDTEAMLHCADVAIHDARRLGGGAFQCYAATSGATEAVSLEGDLRFALERGEFELHFQPQVDLRDGTLCGVEALVRWRHPARGLLFPSDFVTLAEQTGAIVPIGLWVLRSACETMRRWKDAGAGIPRITVNVSGRQFGRRFVDEVAQALCDTDVDPAALELEFTETLTMQSTESFLHLLDELKSFGVRLAIDDFGVGYSQLASLSRLPVDSLKIDRLFVGDCLTNPSNAAIVRGIVTMAAGLDLSVVAEGVESTEQADFLRSLGCDAAQGYLYDPALPLEAIPVFASRDAAHPTGGPRGAVTRAHRLSDGRTTGHHGAGENLLTSVNKGSRPRGLRQGDLPARRWRAGQRGQSRSLSGCLPSSGDEVPAGPDI